MEIRAKKITELEGHQAALYTISKGFSGREILSAGSEKFVAQWDLNKPDLAHIIAKASGVIYSLLPLKARHHLLVGNDQGGIHVIDRTKNEEIRYLLAHAKGVFDLSATVDGKLIFAAGGDGVLSIWNTESYECIKSLKLCDEKIRQVCMHPNLDFLAIACGDGFVRLLDTATFEIIQSWKAHNESANSVCFSPSGDELFSGGKDAYLNIWKLETGEAIKKIPAHNFAIYSIVNSPDGMYFATGSRDKNVKIWHSTNYDILLRIDKEKFEGHTHSVNKLVWTDDGLLISAGDDRRVIVWQLD